jgi:hypothetical protein
MRFELDTFHTTSQMRYRRANPLGQRVLMTVTDRSMLCEQRDG